MSWCCIQHFLSTRIRLNEKGFPLSPSCCRYGKAECMGHVLLYCPYALAVLSATSFSFGQTTVAQLCSRFSDSVAPEQLHCVLMLFWMIWSDRNYLVWKGKNVGVASIVRAADDFQLCWLQSLGVFVVTSEGGDRAGVSRVGGRAGWEPLTVGMLKCNVDFAGSNKIG